MSLSTVDTVTGPVQIDALGATLMHEHVFTFHSDIQGDYPWTEEEKFVDGAIEKLERLRNAGFSSVVDLTVFGLGRKVTRVARIAKASKVNIIVATGIYTLCDMPTYFGYHVKRLGPSFLEDLFVREINEGISDTGIRASILKCVTDKAGVTADVEIVLRATARAQLQTGVPISTHTDANSQVGLQQQRIFREEGVDLEDVIVGHSGDTTDVAYLERLIEAGSYVGMDRFGNYDNCSFENRINTVVELCHRGHAQKIVLSHDANCGGDLNATYCYETWRYGHLVEVVIPELKERGVSDQEIEIMTVENPRQIFARAASKRSSMSGAS